MFQQWNNNEWTKSEVIDSKNSLSISVVAGNSEFQILKVVFINHQKEASSDFKSILLLKDWSIANPVEMPKEKVYWSSHAGENGGTFR